MNFKPEWIISKALVTYARPGGPPGNQIVSSITGPDCMDARVVEYSALEHANAEIDKWKKAYYLAFENNEWSTELIEAAEKSSKKDSE